MSTSFFTSSQVNSFHENGFILLKNFYSAMEAASLFNAALENRDPAYSHPGFENERLSSWFSPENNIFGRLSRSEKIVNPVIELMEIKEPVCHVQSKLLENKSISPGEQGWHQDYSFWKTNDFKSAAQMLTVVVALTPLKLNNGAFKIIEGSHKLPTLVHTLDPNEQSEQVDKAQVHAILQTNDQVYIEMEPGDVLFFHSNLLHCCDANLHSELSLSAVYYYSSASNRNSKGFFTSWFTPVKVIKEEAVFRPVLHGLPNNLPAHSGKLYTNSDNL